VAGDSQVRFVACEDAGQVAKIAAVKDRLPALEQVIAIEPADGALSLTELRERGRGRDHAEVAERIAGVTPEDTYTIIYTSGTTGPPKGCVLSHGNYRQVTRMAEQFGVMEGDEETVYLFLPLAHSYALLIQLLAIDLGGTIAYWSGDPDQIVGDLMAIKPEHLPSVPRIFEKIYTLVTAHNDTEKIAQATQLGLKVRRMQAAGEPVPPELQAAFDQADAELFANVRNIFGGRLKQATSGAAPIAREILEFFFACGAPVLEGYGMTETSTVTTTSTVEDHKLGTVGRALPGSEIRIADDGEILVRGPHIFGGYYGKADSAAFGAVEDGWLHTGDLGALDEDGYLSITGRKKDIIITAGGKNLTPANLENDLKRSRWISQAVMHGDRRPFPVALITLDPEEIVHFAREHGLPEDIDKLSREPKVHELIQGELDRVNANYARVEQIKKFFILDHDLSQETGELTPTLKVKRNVINDRYAGDFEALYAS
jgi:long-chain acyl-CoA synthetase